MTSILAPSIKLSISFRAGSLPAIDSRAPQFLLRLTNVTITGQVTPKAARKLAAHQGGAVLSGKLVEQAGGKLVLLDAGFSFFDAVPAPAAAPAEQKVEVAK